MIWEPDKVIVRDRKYCRYCKTDITHTNHRDICGSVKCKRKARQDDYIKHKDKHIIRNKRNQTRYPHTCPTCGKLFHGAKNQVYCSRSCAHLKLHIYHDRIVELSNRGYSLAEIAEDIEQRLESLKYYYRKHVVKEDILDKSENNT